jgi:hypothetical protein
MLTAGAFRYALRRVAELEDVIAAVEAVAAEEADRTRRI